MRQITDVEQLEDFGRYLMYGPDNEWHFLFYLDICKKLFTTEYELGYDAEKALLSFKVFGPIPRPEELQSLVRDAERYRFLRDEERWNIDEEPKTWAELTEETLGFFDQIVDKKMAQEEQPK